MEAVIFVMKGRSPPDCVKSPTNPGTRKATRARSTNPAKVRITVG